ncbi:MAG: metal-dependent hydrolase [Mariprofundales bacterium]
MDPFTHALAGAAIAGSSKKNSLPAGSMFWLPILAMLPDADYALRFISDMHYIVYHRGMTHSLLLLPLWVLLAYALWPKQQQRWPLLPWIITAVLISHIFLDVMTSFGTMMFSPISDARLAIDLLFIIDPIFSILLFIPVLCGILWSQHRQWLCAVAILSATCYIALLTANHHQAKSLAYYHHPHAEHIAVLPLPFSPFRWQLIAEYPEHYMRTAVDLQPNFAGTAIFFPKDFVKLYEKDLHTATTLEWQRFVSMRDLKQLNNIPGSNFYLWFARFPVLLSYEKDKVIFGDLRFGAGSIPKAPFSLYVQLGIQPKSWLYWRKDKYTELESNIVFPPIPIIDTFSKKVNLGQNQE